MKQPLTERDIDTLGELRAATDNHLKEGYREGWCTPQACGGFNGSHHSATLKKLSDRGLAERKKWGGPKDKGSCWYRITAAGRARIKE
jgi:hypothetical protein